jgi:hypothetical protein
MSFYCGNGYGMANKANRRHIGSQKRNHFGFKITGEFLVEEAYDVTAGGSLSSKGILQYSSMFERV